MKILDPLLLAHYRGRATTTAAALIITRTDGVRLGFTSHDEDKKVLGVVCSSKPGLDISNLVITEGTAVGNLELTTLHDEEVFKDIDIRNGVWKNALFGIYRFNWADLSMAPEALLTGITGNVDLKHSTVVVELLDLRLWLQPTIGWVGSKTCRYDLGVYDGVNSLCPVDLADFTYSFTITELIDNQTFRDDALLFDNDWFTEGLVRFLTGLNAGLIRKVKMSQSDGLVQLVEGMILPLSIGDTGEIIAGCMKRHVEDCINKFDVGIDFGGEPHMPDVDDVTAPTVVNV